MTNTTTKKLITEEVSISTLEETDGMKQEKKSQAAQIAELALPTASYAGLQLQDGNLHIAEDITGQSIDSYEKALLNADSSEAVLTWLKQVADERNLQFVAAALREGDFAADLGAKLWMQADIVPVKAHTTADKPLSPEEMVQDARLQFDQNNLVEIALTPEREVVVSELVTLDDYRASVTSEDFEIATQLAKKFAGKKLVFINATPQGGGVALMRHALIRLLRLLGVDVHWHVLLPKKEVFDITKTKIHNVLQNVASPSTRLTEDDKQIYLDWSKENAELLEPVFKQTDVIVIDDPQPAGLIPYIQQANPDCKILYRSHIQIVAELATKEGTPQHTTWSFLWDFIRRADLFISHPMKMFVPDNVPDEKVMYMPATTDPVDGLNKPLSEQQMETYLKHFNQILIQEGQTPLDSQRPYIVQIARFDPSKGIPDVMDAYRQLRQKLEAEHKTIPQLVIAGNGSIDDPDGVPVYSLIKRTLQTEPYSHFADDIKVARLPHRDQVLNTLLRKSAVVLQLSIKEGFEVKVTEALLKAKPVVAYRVGGIPLQIQDQITGYLVETGNTAQVAQHLYNLLTDDLLYQSMSSAAATLANRDYLTVSNAICWLYLALELLENEQVEGNYQWVKALAQQNTEELVA
ncbi:hypothetical protein KDW_51770 [Dictyobacter vulcani]|uniref:Uncharacterized protein n=1 Tax=Dictyobacter vulcani TaxID=2607529 RepID=A0A5J4KSZ4_9CHLR|nr:glycosyltransferase [Dictyobacter vulcani]GER91015.1 hypothetical protein KDW_51770 [Dictyobacter vulcani]